MKRITYALVAVLLIVGGFVAGSQPWGMATTQETRLIEVAVMFGGLGRGESIEGDSCGFFRIQNPIDPHSKQVVVVDAAGIVVGTIDLLDIFDLSVGGDAFPGAYDKDGLCVVTSTIEVAASTHYTFAIDDEYRWTMSSDDLANRDWRMDISFWSSD